MPQRPNVKVRDKQTGHEYFVSEARFRRTPELWERLTDKPRVSIDEAAARRAGAQLDVAGTDETTDDVHPSPGGEEGQESGRQAESSEEEN